MFCWEKKEYPFSILDADTMKAFDDAEKKMWKALMDYEEANAKDGKLNYEGIKEECKIMDTFMDDVFGVGTAKGMFGERLDLAKRTKAVKKLYGIRKSQLDEHNSRVEGLSELAFSAGQ